MKYVELGNSGMTVSRVCMGCMGFGDAAAGQHSWTLDQQKSQQIIRRGLELGVNFFDTAPVYQGGTSERFLGEALRQCAKRDEVIVATKFPPRSEEERAKGVDGRQHVRNMLNQSLKNLGLETVDLYIYHMWDARTPAIEILEGLNDAVKEGKVRALGISNCFAYQLAKLNALAEREGLAKFIAVQGHYNLIFREEEREMARLCKEDHIAMTPYSPLAGGRLSRLPGASTKRYREDEYAKFKYDATADADGVIIRRVGEVAQRRGVSMTQIALAWLMGKTAAPVVGATNASQVEDAVRATELVLTREEAAYLEEAYVPHRLAGVMAQIHAD